MGIPKIGNGLPQFLVFGRRQDFQKRDFRKSIICGSAFQIFGKLPVPDGGPRALKRVLHACLRSPKQRTCILHSTPCTIHPIPHTMNAKHPSRDSSADDKVATIPSTEGR